MRRVVGGLRGRDTSPKSAKNVSRIINLTRATRVGGRERLVSSRLGASRCACCVRTNEHAHEHARAYTHTSALSSAQMLMIIHATDLLCAASFTLRRDGWENDVERERKREEERTKHSAHAKERARRCA